MAYKNYKNHKDYKTVELKKSEDSEHIAYLVFNRPHAMNTYDFEMSQELPDCIETISEDNNIKVLVLTGANNVFMAGGDINLLKQASEDNKENTMAVVSALHESIMSIVSMDKLVVAAVEGAVAGAGLSIMLACDFAFAAEGTKFNSAYIHLGLSSDGGMTYTLPRLVGHRKAMEILCMSEPFWAEDAQELGLINQVLSQDNFANQINQIALELSKKPIDAVKNIKYLLRNSWQNDIKKQLSEEQECFVACTQTNNFKKGIEAFLNKHKAEFE